MGTRNPSSLQRRLTIAGICLLVLSSLGFLYGVLAGDCRGLKAWLLPFAPLCPALIIGSLVRQKQQNDKHGKDNA